MDLFLARDYKAYISARLEIASERGAYTRLAKAAGCQSSFLSHVLRGDSHLSLEHATGIAEHWGFDELATEYFLTLVMQARAGSRQLSSFLDRKLTDLRSRYNQLSHRFDRPHGISDEKFQAIYYSSWHYAAVHVALSSPNLRTTEALAKELVLPHALVARTLDGLESMGLAVMSDGKWEATEQSIHLSAKSPFAKLAHTNWRHLALQHHAPGSKDQVFYTGVHMIERSQVEAFHAMVKDFLVVVQKKVEASAAEQVVCLNVDFFSLMS